MSPFLLISYSVRNPLSLSFSPLRQYIKLFWRCMAYLQWFISLRFLAILTASIGSLTFNIALKTILLSNFWPLSIEALAYFKSQFYNDRQKSCCFLESYVRVCNAVLYVNSKSGHSFVKIRMSFYGLHHWYIMANQSHTS